MSARLEIEPAEASTIRSRNRQKRKTNAPNPWQVKTGGFSANCWWGMSGFHRLEAERRVDPAFELAVIRFDHRRPFHQSGGYATAPGRALSDNSG
jgi:hypothetical protein